MRYQKDHKKTTRRRIVRAASEGFRQKGLAGAGVAGLMKQAGLTHGGFYGHFSSKQQLLREALEEAFGDSERNFRQKLGRGSTEELIRAYLRPEHRDSPALGCAAAALAAEVARQPKAVRAAFTSNLQGVLAVIEAGLPARQKPARRRKTALGIFAVLMGTLQLSRAASDASLSNEFLAAGIAAALSLAGLKKEC